MSVSFRPLPSGSSTVRQSRCGPLGGIPPPVVDHLAFVWLPVCSQMTRAEWDFTRQHRNSERESAVNNKRLIGFVSQMLIVEPFGSILSSCTPLCRRRCRSMLRAKIHRPVNLAEWLALATAPLREAPLSPARLCWPLNCPAAPRPADRFWLPRLLSWIDAGHQRRPFAGSGTIRTMKVDRQ
jgi:hypothetical protein